MPSTKTDDELKWLTIEDFSPGIVQNIEFANGFNRANGSPAPGKALGMAQQAQGCISLPNGGLGPLPGLAATTPWGASTPVAPQHAPSTGANLMTGLFLNGPIFYYGTTTPYPQTQGDELIIGQSQITSGGLQDLWIDSLQANITNQSAAVNNIVAKTGLTSRLPLATMTGAITRANSTPSLIGNPCWAFAYYIPAGAAGVGNSGYWALILYPDPTNPGTGGFAPYVLINGSGGPGDVFCHQNRVVYLQSEPQFWTSDFTLMGGNEAFVYTDPPNGVALLSGAGEVFVQEDPSGYGAWGSQSASELFLVKHRLGGVVISGDLNVPTVTVLPGVMPTGGVVSRGASTQLGFVYAVNKRGLYAWTGGIASQKISNQLVDDFFVNRSLPAIQRGPTVDIQRWGDWIVVTNDWLFDTIGGGWWQLNYGAQDAGHLWYQASSDGQTLYATPAIPTTTVGLECYSRASPSTFYSWTSYPIRLPSDSKNRNLRIREIVLRVQGAGQVFATLTGINGTSTVGHSSPADSVTFDAANGPQMQRIAIGLEAQDVTLALFAEGQTVLGVQYQAPIIYSVSIGYEEDVPLVSAT